MEADEASVREADRIIRLQMRLMRFNIMSITETGSVVAAGNQSEERRSHTHTHTDVMFTLSPAEYVSLTERDHLTVL